MIILKLVIYKLKYICFRVLLPRNFNKSRNILDTLLKPSGITCVDLKDLGIRRSLLDVIYIFNGKL